MSRPIQHRPGFTRALRLMACAASLALAVSCGSATAPTTHTTTGGDTGKTTSTSNQVSVVDNSFSPSATTVTSGTTVTWTWGGSASHNVTFDDGAHSATQSSGTYARTFTTPGTYNYKCTIHGAAMSGSVTVQ